MKKSWGSHFIFCVAVLVVSASAEDATHSPTTFTNFRAPIQFNSTTGFRKSANDYFQLDTSGKPGSKHYWYWERISQRATSSPNQSVYLPARPKANQPGFTPASLKWDFSGKHKAIPVIDLTVKKFRPGEKTLRGAPSAEPNGGSFVTKASHSISELLHEH